MPNLLCLNLSKNELGVEGGRHLAKNLNKMKKLEELRLAECNITDRGIIEIIQSLDELGTIDVLDLSGNQIGKSAHFGDLATKMEKFLQSSHLEKLHLDNNNLRAAHGEKILKAVCGLTNLSVLSLKQNFLGQALGNAQAPIVVLANLLITSPKLEYLDIGYNGIEGRSIYCLTEALVINRGLQCLSMEGNPLGKMGIALLMKAKTRNFAQDFSINLAESGTDSAEDPRIKIFEMEKPEGPYSFDLTKMYDQLVLQHLLTISAEVVIASNESGGAPIEQKMCFYQVKLDGKSKWEVPSLKTPEGLWDLGPEPKGNLVFTFTSEPLDYKKELSRLNREAAAMEPAKLAATDPAKLKPVAKEVLTEATVSRPVISEKEFEHTMHVLLKNYQNKNFVSNDQAVTDTAHRGSFWSDQIKEILKVFKDEATHFEVLSRIAGKVRDQHNRLCLFTPMTLVEFTRQQGDVFAFSAMNPTGNYSLNLANVNHREVVKCLLFINKQNFEKIAKTEAFDRSALGTKSCFRNEKINKGVIKWTP